MKAPEERVLELALLEVVGRVRPPDLTLRILGAARAEAEAAPRARGLRRPSRWFAAAAVLLALLGPGLWWLLSEGPPAPVIVATSDADVLAFVDGEARRLRTFRGDERVVVPGPEAATLTLRDGTRVEISAPGAVVLRTTPAGTALELQAGRLRVRPVTETLVTSGARQGEYRVGTGSDVTFEALLDPWLTGESLMARLTGAWETGAVVVELEAGTIDHGTLADRRTLEAPALLVHWDDGEREVGELPAVGEREALGALLAKARTSSAEIEGEGQERARRVKELQVAGDRLATALRERPSTRLWLRPRLHLRPRTDEGNSVHRRLLDILFVDDHARTRRVFESVLETTPEVIEDRKLLLLAEGGFEGAVRFLKRIVAEGRGRGLPRTIVLPALYFAVRDDDRGRVALQDAFANEGLFTWARTTWLAAGAGLAFLGDDAAWERLIEKVESEVEAALEARNLDLAGRLVLGASYFHRILGIEGSVPVANTHWNVQEWQRVHAERADTAGEIRQVLERLRVLPR